MAVQLYVGTERGTVTLREGKRGKWDAVHRALPNRHVVAIDYDRKQPNMLYMAVANEGIYSSSDGGDSAIFRVGGDAHALHVRRDAPKQIYAGMGKALVWASGDGGVTWERLDSFRELWGDPEQVSLGPRPRSIVRAVWGAPGNTYGILAGVDPGGLAFSLDGGHIWNFVDDGPRDVRSLTASPADVRYLIAATGDGVMRSVNGGANWQSSNDGLPAGPVRWVSATRGHLYTSVNGALYRTAPGLPKWEAVSAPASEGISAVAYNEMDSRMAAGLFYGTCEGRIVHSKDNGATWTEILEGLPPVTCIAVTDD
jgi:photosystem II stability/assembly factor-like uncharacterized protein